MTANNWNNLQDRDLAQIDVWCDQFEARWKRGERPSIETVVQAVPAELRACLRRELVCLELDLRLSTGDVPVAEDYGNRFPELNAEIVKLVCERMHVASTSGPELPPLRPTQNADLPPLPQKAGTGHPLLPFRDGESSEIPTLDMARIDLPKVQPRRPQSKSRAIQVITILVLAAIVLGLVAWWFWPPREPEGGPVERHAVSRNHDVTSVTATRGSV